MSTWLRIVLGSAVAGFLAPAQAESLRCAGGIAAEGDSRSRWSTSAASRC